MAALSGEVSVVRGTRLSGCRRSRAKRARHRPPVRERLWADPENTLAAVVIVDRGGVVASLHGGVRGSKRPERGMSGRSAASSAL